MALSSFKIILCASSNALPRVFLYVCSHFSGSLVSYHYSPLLLFLVTSFLRRPPKPCFVSDDLTKPLMPLLNQHLLRVCSFQTLGRYKGQHRTTQATSVFVFTTFFSFHSKYNSETTQIELTRTAVSEKAFQDEACCCKAHSMS